MKKKRYDHQLPNCACNVATLEAQVESMVGDAVPNDEDMLAAQSKAIFSQG